MESKGHENKGQYREAPPFIMKGITVMKIYPDPKYKKEILAQPIRELVDDLCYVAYQVDQLNCQSDYADYARESEWYDLFFNMKEEIIRRTEEES